MSIFYRLRIRNAADSADALVVTSVPSGTNPYISEPPTGDGQGFNPRTGATEVGAYIGRIADNGAGANAVTSFLADGNGRYDKLGRRAYWEYGTDGVNFPNMLVPGYVTGISFPSAAEAMISVGEAQRTERVKQAFTVATTTFPPTTMLGGGPVRWPAGVNVLPINLPNRGPWTMKRFDTSGASGVVNLIFVSGYVLKDDKATEYTLATNGALPSYMASRINTLVATEVPGAAVGPTAGIYRVGNVFAEVYSAGVLVGTFQAIAERPDLTIGNQVFLELEWTSAAAAGTEYQVYLYTKTISENNPLHLLMHPVDLVTGLIDDAAELWDTTSAAAVKASIGADVRLFLRVTASESTEAAITRYMGLFGFGRRMNSANKWEFFDQRTKTTSAPSATITLDDLRELPTKVWDQNDASILNTITVTAQRFAIWAPGQSTTRPPDSLVPVEQKRTARFQLADGSFPDVTQGVKEQTYAIQGTILNAQGAEVNLTDFVNALAAPAFDRWGYGAPASGLACRPTVTAQIGDEVLLNVNYLPNGTVRGGQRIVQVLQRTNEPGGPVLQFEDAGATAQPSLAPTFTIVASTGNPYARADVALTNAVALAAAGVQAVVVEWQVSVLSPVIAGQDLGSILPAAPLTLTTPQVAAGAKVWARMKSIQPGKRSGTFTSWAGVTLSAVGAPGSLAHTPNGSDGSKGTLTWTAGANSALYTVRVLRRLSALSAANDTPVLDLKPGSLAAPLDAMTPGVSYTATVQYVDPASGIVAASASATFTAGGVTATLSAPTNPVSIVGSTDENGIGHIDGTYGLDVTATVLPGTVEFWEAIETAVGSGTYGTAVQVGKPAPSVSGGPTSYRSVAPNDGLRRQLKARHVATGATASSFTTPVAMNPWGTILGPPSVGPSLDVQATQGTTSTSIAYTANTSVDLSINGGAYSAAPASPIVVSRPAAGAAALEYDFRVVYGAQTITNSVTIPAIDANTITPNLSVTPSTPATTTQDFTLAASDPSGGAAPTMTVILRGTTGSYPAFPLTLLDGVTYSGIPSGALLTINRPAFNTTTQASMEVYADIGGARERIYRTILNQVKDQFGPNLSVQVTPGATSYSIVWSGSGVLVSINGGAFASPSASPITVTRNAFDGAPIEYVFSGTQDGRTVTVAVTIPQQQLGSVAKSLLVSGAAFQPTTSGAAATINQDKLVSGAGAGVSQTFIAFVPLPQGVTITGISMSSKCSVAGTTNNVLKLYRQVFSSIATGVNVATATRTAVNTDVGGTDSSGAVSELVSTLVYCLVLSISGDTNHEFYTAKVDYTMPTYDKGI